MKEVTTNDIELKEKIGTGSFGVVSKAVWKFKNMMVAVKKIHMTSQNIPQEVKNVI